MTENEAIERIIRSACSSGKCYDACLYGEGNCEYDAAITALKEVQRYREIGTVEECKELASMVTTEKKNVLGKIVDEWNEYIEIGTVEECREAVEKQRPKRPVWKKGSSVICKDYADGHGEVEENKWADWVCPNCGWFVGEQYIPRRHNQQKSNYCSRCGQAIRWDANAVNPEYCCGEYRQDWRAGFMRRFERRV